MRISQTGFSAVELMITLFLGVAFIGSGYQLYSIAVVDGRDVRLRALASSIAYSQMRSTAATVSNPCAISDVTNSIDSSSGLTNATQVKNIACPYGTAASVSAVTVTVNYGTDNPQKKVSHAIYVTAR